MARTRAITYILTLALSLIFLVSCMGRMDYADYIDTVDERDERILCECGEHYICDQLRQPTPPMNMHEMFVPRQAENSQEVHADNVSEFTREFENIYTITYTQFETDWPVTLVLWPDITLYDFSFVSLDVAGHYWDESTPYDHLLVIHTREVLLTVSVLHPTDAVVLNIAFAHYLLPHGAVVFTDTYGIRWRMFVQESMRGGCFPIYGFGWPHRIDE